MKSELEIQVYNEEEPDKKNTTARIKKAVVEALRDVYETITKTSKNASLAAEEARKAYIMAERIDARQAKQIEAEIKAKSNELATLKSQAPK